MASRSKLSPAQADGLGAAYRNGTSTTILAETYDVSERTITKYLIRAGTPRRSRGRPRIYPVQDDYFDEIGEAQAYWLGFIQGDGSVREDCLVVGLKSSDEDHLVRLRSAIGSHQPIVRRTNEAFGGKWPVSRLLICSKRLVGRLAELGVRPNKTFDSEFPAFLTRDLQRHWLRGLFDADGCISRLKGDLSAAVTWGGYRPVIRDIRDYLTEEVGAYRVALVREKAASVEYCKITYGGYRTPREIYYHLYEDATVWLPRKRQIFEKLFLDREMQKNEVFVPAGIRVPIEVLASQMNVGMF
jgi:hypothetical protein